MSSSSEIINIEAKAQRIAVDNRIALRFYFRIANNVLKQAAIFRAENNLIDLYVMLLRFSSLALETIPSHRDYRTSSKYDKEYLRMRSLDVLTELEKLKPAVQRILVELKAKHTRQAFQGHQHGTGLSVQYGIRKPTLTNYHTPKVAKPAGGELSYQSSRSQKFMHAGPVQDQFRNLSANFPQPSVETLSKHSILGPKGLHGQWQPPKSDRRQVQYPSNIDLTPVEIPSYWNYPKNEVTAKQDNSISAAENEVVDSSTTLNGVDKRNQAEEPASLISFEESDSIADNNIIRQPSPPPVRAEVHDLIPAACPEVPEVECKMENSLSDVSLQSESPLQLHISTTMLDTFMRLAKSNTSKNLETCGILAGVLKDRKFFITALIVPKQESTSDSCQATNEEEIFEVQDTRSLFPLGWIHTHPTQSCFMSSIDLHTHYSYQIMLPESVAIVMAPKDSSRKHGIFRLTTPGGMSVIRHCEQRGFHPHNPPSDGGPIYKTCTDVYMNPNLKFDVIDLR